MPANPSIVVNLRPDVPEIALGQSGIIARIRGVAVVCESEEDPGVWLVGSLASDDGVEIYATVFAGPKAQERAAEYARAKYAGVNLFPG